MSLRRFATFLVFASEVCAEPSSPASASESVVVATQQRALPPLPCLPNNLDDLDRQELKQFLVQHHASWLRTANQLVSFPEPATQHRPQNQTLKVWRKAQRRRGNYWKAKASKEKKQLTDKYNQLVLESSVYVQSKRRKSTAVGRRMTVFSGRVFQNKSCDNDNAQLFWSHVCTTGIPLI